MDVTDEETQAWERLRAAVLRRDRDPTPFNIAAAERARDELARAMERNTVAARRPRAA